VPATTTTTTVAATTTSSPPTSTTAPANTTTTERDIDIEIRGGEVSGTDRFRFDRGQTVQITVLSDTVYEVHVHGYDLRYDLEPGEPHTIEFTADVPGIFEVETHPDHLILFDIEVGG
jgi:heme/copper-type cytochrome/quinol oxidase subunit 2